MSLGRQIFVIHGRDERARRELFTFLRAIGLTPIEWIKALTDAGGGSPHISDVIDKALSPNRAFIVLFTPDDVAYLKEEHADGKDDLDLRPTGQARPNVLFEAGMAFGRHPDHTVLVEFGKVRRFTDVDGRFKVRLDNTPQSRMRLARRLEAIGCEVDLTGTDYLSEGDLTPPETEQAPSQPLTAATTTDSSPPPASSRPEFTSSTGPWNVQLENFSIVARKPAGYVVHGEITNNDQSTLMLRLKATFHDDSLSILGSAGGTVNSLATTERRPFELTSFDPVDDIARVHVHIDNGIET
jgi:hypothetical protein